MPDPISTAGSYLLEKVVGNRVDALITRAIERWSRHRAEQFFRAFSYALHTSSGDRNTLDLLDSLMEDEYGSQLVFDAYRLVCLSKSRTLGPRIIAILTAKIIQRDNQVASEWEERVFAAAEAMSDNEFESFRKEFDRVNSSDAGRLMAMLQRNGKREVCLSINEFISKHDSNNESSLEISSGSLVTSLGSWAEKMSSLGLASEKKIQISTVRGARQVGEPVQKLEWKFVFNEPSFLLRDLIGEAEGVPVE